MSLDISLVTGEERFDPCPQCDGSGRISVGRTTAFDTNITHNLAEMAAEAGLYQAVWRPDEAGITRAGQLVSILEDGIRKLCTDPDKYRALEPANKWGTYEVFIPWLEQLLDACREYPDAAIEVSR